MHSDKIARETSLKNAASRKTTGTRNGTGLRSAESGNQLRLLRQSGIASGPAAVVQRAPIEVTGTRYVEAGYYFDLISRSSTGIRYRIERPFGTFTFLYSPDTGTYSFGEQTYPTLAALVNWLDKGKMEETDAPSEGAAPVSSSRPKVADRMPASSREKTPTARQASPYQSLHAADLTRPRKFALEGSERESQSALFTSLDRTFEEREIATGNKGILSVAIRVDEEGIALHSTGKIREEGAMKPLEEPLPEEEQEAVVRLVENVLRGSGQWAYLERNREHLINQDWSVIVDVDFYYSRNRGQTRFHMDSSGETLFTNLIYNDFAQREKLGPETISDLSFLPNTDHEMLDANFGGENQFPGRLARDVGWARRGLYNTNPVEAEIKGEKVAPLDIVSFTDPTTLHATPAPRGHNEDDYTAKFIRETKQIQLPKEMKRTVPAGVSSDLREGHGIREGDDPQRRSFIRMWVQIVRLGAQGILLEVNEMNGHLQNLTENILRRQLIDPETEVPNEGDLYYSQLLKKLALFNWIVRLRSRLASGQVAETYDAKQKKQLTEALLETIRSLRVIANYLTDTNNRRILSERIESVQACIDLLGD